ncbi:MAG: DUF4294 domain-containing protein [bacterium]|nr:DUF4294 domain-containing protein [bacterium]
MRAIFLFISMVYSFFWVDILCAQNAPLDSTKRDTTSVVKVGYQIEGNDTIAVYLQKKFNYKGETVTKEEKEAFLHLAYDVKKALPYAKLAAFRLQLMEDNLNLMTSEREKKKYVKACEKAIKKQFMDDLKNMTISQGKILLKLIHRETGKSTWEILNNYRGGLETLFWQAMAKTYNANMKDTYDPVVDYKIEEIIKTLEIENAP